MPLSRAVGERGSGLSAGQRRRVALARALLPPQGQRPVLLLDEPTAGLDAATEARVLATLRAEAGAGRAILIAAHRPAVLAIADRITLLPGAPDTPDTPDAPDTDGVAPATGAVPAGAAPVAAAEPPPLRKASSDPGHAGDADDRGRTGRRLTLAGLLGTLAAVCSIGLLATSAWLISRAAERPPVLYLMVAVTAVQAFAIGVLLRFLDPAAGTVTVGGTDIMALESDTVRRIVGLCAQDAHIFDSTLEANLRLARPDASPGELRDALRRVRLLDWVDSLPSGLATPVGEHGAQLSGGQRQRLALARVLLADFPVVVLDEPAEHLDDDTARELTRDLLTATEGRTRLLITHRPVDAAEVDQIVRLGAAGPMETAPRALVPTVPLTAAV